MTICTLVALIILLTPAFGAQAADPPHDGKFRPSQLPGVEEAYLRPIFPSSHAANLLVRKNGDLMCSWFSGTWEGNSDVAILLAILRKGASKWSKPRVVDHHPGESYQNPVLFESPDGTLWIFHTTQSAGQGEANAKVLVTRSRDGGEHWTAPEVLFDTPGAFVRQPVVVMPDEKWLLPIYISHPAGGGHPESSYSAVKISDDRGAHWKECSVPESTGYVQPDVIRASGPYLAFFRSRAADFIYRSESPDGCAWTAPQKTTLPNNNSSIQIAKLANGHLVLAFNNRSKTGPRKPLSVAVSKDGGETWRSIRDLETGPSAPEPGKDPMRKEPGREEYSYPSIVQTHDGKIYVAYTYERRTIKIVRFDEKWIERVP